RLVLRGVAEVVVGPGGLPGQAGILERDGGLLCKGLEEGDLVRGEGADDAAKYHEGADRLPVPEQWCREHRAQPSRALDRHRIFKLSLGNRFEVPDMHGAPVVHGASGHGATTDGKAPADRDGTSQRSML